MKRILLVLSILLFQSMVILFAQAKMLLSDISKKIFDYKTYKTTCDFTLTFPSKDSLSFKSMITIKKEEQDSICGFYYYFLTDEKD